MKSLSLSLLTVLNGIIGKVMFLYIYVKVKRGSFQSFYVLMYGCIQYFNSRFLHFLQVPLRDLYFSALAINNNMLNTLF